MLQYQLPIRYAVYFNTLKFLKTAFSNHTAMTVQEISLVSHILYDCKTTS